MTEIGMNDIYQNMKDDPPVIAKGLTFDSKNQRLKMELDIVKAAFPFPSWREAVDCADFRELERHKEALVSIESKEIFEARIKQEQLNFAFKINEKRQEYLAFLKEKRQAALTALAQFFFRIEKSKGLVAMLAWTEITRTEPPYFTAIELGRVFQRSSNELAAAVGVFIQCICISCLKKQDPRRQNGADDDGWTLAEFRGGQWWPRNTSWTIQDIRDAQIAKKLVAGDYLEKPVWCKPCQQAQANLINKNQPAPKPLESPLEKTDEWPVFPTPERLRELKAMPYQKEYLKSPEWRTRRGIKIQEAGEKCQVCGSSGRLNVHHNTYARRGNESRDDLVVLCEECHCVFHDNGKLAKEPR